MELLTQLIRSQELYIFTARDACEEPRVEIILRRGVVELRRIFRVSLFLKGCNTLVQIDCTWLTFSIEMETEFEYSLTNVLHVFVLSLITVNQLDSFFFFYWHYNPLWILAFSVILFHSAHSLHCFLHHLIPIICISSSMPAIHLFLGLPLILVPIGFHSNILLGVPLLSIRIT